MKKIAISIPVVILISLLAQALGLVKNIILVSDFGANVGLDIFLFCSTLSTAIFSIVSSAIITVVVPTISSKNSNKNEDNGVGQYIGILILLGICLSSLLVFFILIFKGYLFPKYNEHYQNRVIVSFIILIIGQIFQIPQSYFSALLQVDEHYISSKISILFQNVIPVVYLVAAITYKANLEIITFITAMSFFITFVITYFFTHFFKIKSTISFPVKPVNKNVKPLILKTGPMLLSSSIYQLQLIVSGYFAVNYASGTVTIFNNANLISGAIQGIVIANILNIFYPTIVKKVQHNEQRGLDFILKYSFLLTFIMACAVVLYFLIGEKIVEFVFVHGAFSKQDGVDLFIFSSILIVGIIFDILRDSLYRYYYALGNTSIPTKNSIQTVIINLLLIAILSPMVHEKSIVIAPTIGTIVSLLSIIYKLKLKNSYFPVIRIFMTYCFILLLAAILYLMLYSVSILASTNIGILSCSVITLMYILFFTWVYRKKQKFYRN